MKGTISMSEVPISRGFRPRRREQVPKNRVPPGQYVTTDFPVLSAGKLDFCPSAGRKPTRQMDLGRVRSAPSDHDQGGHSLRHQMVEARYDVAGRDV
jgi:hypothetical protein